MSSKQRELEGRLVVHDAVYRIVVLKNPEPAHPDDAVHAHCLEQDLAGRGKDVASALNDLAITVTDELIHELQSAAPEYAREPDPDLLNAFERNASEVDGMQVIRMLRLLVQIAREARVTRRGAGGKSRSTSVLLPQVVSFQPAVRGAVA
jgi:hypothetical protein